MKILVETALLGHGLPSVSDDTIRNIWPNFSDVMLVWLENGKIKADGIEEFLKIRRNSDWKRISRKTIDESIDKLESGFLTASAVMKIAYEKKIDVVVTAGMGGIRKDTLSDDLYCLMDYPIMLIASSPKDSLEIGNTISFLKDNNVSVMGYGTDIVNGFIFKSEDINLPERYKGNYKDKEFFNAGGVLLLNQVPCEERINDKPSILLNSIAEGEKDIKNFHPTVNFYLDKYSGGVSSELQIKALVSNLKLANFLVGERE